ncbi:hypothetical protein SAMN05518801_13414 [Novosphingobium sp. CF614]|nr:hypothetical protein SAMN05518801_13414 [Novosphingobium sp. CF614]
MEKLWKNFLGTHLYGFYPIKDDLFDEVILSAKVIMDRGIVLLPRSRSDIT